MNKRKRRNYTASFKEQVVKLYLNGKPRKDIISEYELTSSAFSRWVNQYKQSGSFAASDNKTAEQKENEQLKKQIRQLQMENDILKQAALIMGRK